MASKPSKNTGEKKHAKTGETKARDLDIKNLSKQSFQIKCDLDGTDYQPIENIGIGAYGVVCSAIHKKTTDKVAIKKIPFVFDGLVIAKRTYREIKILKHFKHDNIISIREILRPKESYHDFKDIHVVFDLMESDLHRIIYSDQPLTEEHIRYFLYQILRGLKYIHSANVVHRDLKPSNLLVNEDCHVRIGDLGMARGVNSQPEELPHYMTQYVATRWYRAPEILLSMLEYGTAVDMWSVGCIFAEMLGRKPLFPGKDYLKQVQLVLGLLGTPSESVLNNCQNDLLRRIIKTFGHRQPMPWTTLFPKASKKALDLLGKMLVINPADRTTVERALKHPFLSKYHDPDDEPICVPSFEFDFEKELLHMDPDQLREVIYKEIMAFHQPRTPTLSFLACLRPAPKSEGAPEGSGEEGGGVVSPSLTDQLQAMISKVSPKPDVKEEEKESKQFAPCNAHEPKRDSTQETTAPSLRNIPPTLQTQQEAEVFKKPADKPTTKKSPVSVETTNLQLTSGLSDVEMLSAQSTDGNKAMETQTPRTPMEREKEVKGGEKKENKTISEDTKALVKQALLSHRQRTESFGDDDRPRPVTAAQRQREREEKRKKKRDSRMKKMQEKKKNIPDKVELSDADKVMLARWSSMQKKETSADLPQTTVPAPVTTLVYLPANSSVPSPPQPNPGLSPPHPAPTSTSPTTILPAGVMPHGAVTLVTGQMGVGQGSIIVPQGQVMLPHASLAQSLGPSVSLQGQASVQGIVAQADPQTRMITLEDLQRHAGGKLQITESQAEALKEALKLSQTNLLAENGGGEAGLSRPVHSPSQGDQDASKLSPAPDPSRSPHQSSTSPALGQPTSHSPHSFSPPPSRAPDMAFTPSPAGQTSPYQPGFEPNSETTAKEGPHLPQNLSEFLERHSQKPEGGDTLVAGPGSFTSARFQADIKINSFGDGSEPSQSAQDLADVKREESGFSSCQFMSAQIKPEVSFPEERVLPQQMLSTPQASSSMVHSSVPPFQNTMFPADSGGRSVCYSVQTHSVAGSLPQAPSYFIPSNTGVSFAHSGNPQLPGSMSAFSYSAQESVEGSSHVPLPFTRYADTVNFQMLSARDGDVHSTLGMESHSALAMGAGHGMGQVVAMGSHSMGQASMEPSLAQSSVRPHHNLVPADQASVMMPSNSYGHQPSFQPMAPGATHNMQAAHVMQASAQNVHHSLDPQFPPQLQPHLHHPTPPHPASAQQQVARETPNLRVSAPKQDGVDLVAMLSNKLSSIFPPSLSLTPRGTGAGYGVGMDLDILMADAADNAGRGAELSPLSSSLLADWLDLSGNISQADLDALEHDFAVTSPMAMSYTDFQSSNPSTSNSHDNWE